MMLEDENEDSYFLFVNNEIFIQIQQSPIFVSKKFSVKKKKSPISSLNNLVYENESLNKHIVAVADRFIKQFSTILSHIEQC